MTYLGYDIFEPLIKSPETYTISNGYSVIGEYHTAREILVSKETDIRFKIEVYQDSHEERKVLKDFFIGKKGKLLPFWYLSPIPIGTVISTTATNIVMKDVSMVYWVQNSSVFLYVESTGYMGRIEEVKKAYDTINGKQEVLVMREPVNSEINPGDYIHVLMFSRFDQDRLNIQAESYTTSTAQLTIKELQADAKKLHL